MKNIHLIPTDKPSRLYKSKITQDVFISDNRSQHGDATYNVNIHITSDEEIKEEDWYYLPRTNSVYKCIEDPTELNLERRLGVAKIILTTDQDLIKDGVQAIDDEFLEWFVKNPSCEIVEVESWETKGEWNLDYKIIIPQDEAKQRAKNYMSLKGALEPKQIKCYCGHTSYCDCSPLEEPKQETLEEAAERYSQELLDAKAIQFHEKSWIKAMFIWVAKWQQERMYSDEEVLIILEEFKRYLSFGDEIAQAEWFEQFKKK